jgi:hypothetical protein
MTKQEIVRYIQKLRVENSQRPEPMPDQHLVQLIRLIEQLS